MATKDEVDQCCNCTKPTPASMWCGDCNGCYCPTCSQSLHQIVALAKHRPMPLSTKPPDPILCSVHPDEKLKYWCSNHEIAICRDCLLFEHKDETYALIDKVAKDVSAKLELKLQITQSTLNQRLQDAQQLRNSTENCKKTAIRETRAALQSMIDQHFKVLEQEIDAIEHVNHTATEAYCTQLEDVKKKLGACESDVTKTLASKNNMKVMQEQKALANNMDEVVRSLQEVMPPVKEQYWVEGIDELQATVVKCLSSARINRSYDEEDTVVVADYRNNRIVEWKRGATSGTVLAGGNGEGIRPDQLSHPKDVFVDKETNSLIICNNRLTWWPRGSGTRSEETITDITCCGGLAMDDEGSLYVTDVGKHEVRRYHRGETSGTVVAGGNGKGAGPHQLNDPSKVWVDGEHAVYVSDSWNHRVMKWVKGAKEGIVVAGGWDSGSNVKQLSYPNGVWVDAAGNVYVTDMWNNRVVRWCRGAPEGTVVVGGNGAGGGVNQLYYPNGLFFDRQGSLYVADLHNHRVQRFTLKNN